jgi:chromosome segregation protein
MAEVVLVFENPGATDGTRTLNRDFDEVASAGRLYRDGTASTRSTTTTPAEGRARAVPRHRVGVDAYSVIEQGRVAALLEANPDERRLIFEEAAGISKFKQRKKEAVRKLEKVDQNLLRVNDIVEEVERRPPAASRLQAGKAGHQVRHDRLTAAAATRSASTTPTTGAELQGGRTTPSSGSTTRSPTCPAARTRWPRSASSSTC